VIGLLRGEEVPRLAKEWHLANPNRRPIVDAWDHWAPAHGLPPEFSLNLSTHFKKEFVFCNGPSGTQKHFKIGQTELETPVLNAHPYAACNLKCLLWVEPLQKRATKIATKTLIDEFSRTAWASSQLLDHLA